MKLITEYLSTKIVQTKIKATNDTIDKIVKDELDRLGYDADLNHIDVSEMTDMYSLFNCNDYNLGIKYKNLNPDISGWDVSNVEDMRNMFYECENFNCDISSWNVSNVENMDNMFYKCKNFNQPLDIWDVSNVTSMQWMFINCEKFNQDLSQWDVSKVENMCGMFYNCPIKEKHKPKYII